MTILHHPAAIKAETRYLSCAETAKLIRQALKEAFPSIRFSVRSRTYSGGASIDVRYVNGPAPKDVEAVAERFQGGYFDGMTDYKGGHVHALADAPNVPVHFGADFVFVRREISAGVLKATEAALAALDDVQRNNLEARLSLGEFSVHHIRAGERLYTEIVAASALPAIAPLPSPTAQGVRLVRSY